MKRTKTREVRDGEDDDADGDQDHSLGEAALWYSRGGRGGECTIDLILVSAAPLVCSLYYSKHPLSTIHHHYIYIIWFVCCSKSSHRAAD
jgi:hypothetical protein